VSLDIASRNSALALRVYVHPLAEGLARAGAHLDDVVARGR
jgi:hypothetical protein